MTDNDSNHHAALFQLEKETVPPREIAKWVRGHLKKCEKECQLFVRQNSDDLTSKEKSRRSSCSGQISPASKQLGEQLEFTCIPEHSAASQNDGDHVTNAHDAIGEKRKKRPYNSERFSDSQDHQQMCQCGKIRQEHNQTALKEAARMEGAKWDESCKQNAPTDAFGEVNFIGHGQKISRYVRVDHETRMGDMMYFVKKLWKLELPNLLISVTGGAKDFSMAPGVKEVFRRGLIKAALSTGAWIVTGGTNAGVMKQVGEAVHDYTAAHGNRGRLVVLGVTPWGPLLDKRALINPTGEGLWPAEYNSGQVIPSKTCALDPNHTHFILVDDGSQNEYRGEINFRINLEATIADRNSSAKHANKAKSTPIVCVVLEGGPGTLDTVYQGVMKNIPAVIVQGSGRVADILAYAYEISSEKSFLVKLREKFPGWKNEDIMKIEKIVQRKNCVTIFKLSDRREGKEIDVALLNALLKVNDGKSDQQKNNLDLAVTWNRLDIAEKILGSSAKPRPEELDDIMHHVIKANRSAFVDLLFENGVNPKTFLTRERLEELYKEISRNCLLHKLLRRKKRKTETQFSLATVGRVISDLVGNCYTTKYLQKESSRGVSQIMHHGVEDPIKELFIYSILLQRKDMAFYFWTEGKESLGLAVLAQNLLRKMRTKSEDADLKKELDDLIQFFKDLSMDILTECYASNERKARLMLVRKLSFGETTVTELAIKAQHKELIGHPACQTMLNSVWMGWLHPDNRLWQLCLCALCFPFCLLLRYRGDQDCIISTDAKNRPASGTANRKSVLQNPDADENVGRISCSLRLKRFFCAPITKFLYNTLAYLVFLGYYSYVLLGQGLPVSFTVQEYILIAWIVTIALEEVRQMIQAHLNSNSRAVSYIKDPWNLLDVVTLLTFFAGVALRVAAVAADCKKCGSAGHYIMTFNLMTFYCRLLHIFSVHRQLGPKLVMIGNMMKDLLYFLVIVMVFLVGYGIAMQHLLYPNTPLSWSALEKLLQRAFFQFNGEFQLEEATGNPEECPVFESVQTCPEDNPIPPIVLGVYVLVMNVLMLNLLIAMFSNTYAVVQQNSDVVYKVQRYFVILEFYNRLPLPPPLVIFSHLYAILRLLARRCCHACQKDGTWFYVKMEGADEREMVLWESLNVEECLRKKDSFEKQSIEHQIKLNNEEVVKMSGYVEQLSSRVDELSRRPVIPGEDKDSAIPKPLGKPSSANQGIAMTSSAQMDVLSKRVQTIEEKIDRIAEVLLKE